MRKNNPYGCDIKDFILEHRIGHGGFAEVLKARSRKIVDDTLATVAIKRINKEEIRKRKCEARILREIEIHSQLPRNYCYVEFYTSFEDEKFWYLVLELCTGGSLSEYLKNPPDKPRNKLSEEEAIPLIIQVIDGVNWLHKQLVIHRDLSLKNLLLTEDHQVKIADFGLAGKLNACNDQKKSSLGTANFMSPEVARGEYYDLKTDCWSVGCVLYNLLYGSPPPDIRKKNYRLTFPDFASAKAKALLRKMLKVNAKERIDLQNVLEDPFFQTEKKKSGDSGITSLSRSESLLTPIQGRRSPEIMRHKSRKEMKIKEHLTQNVFSDKKKANHSSFELQNNANHSGFIHQLKPKIQTLPSRLESHPEDYTKSYPTTKSFPTCSSGFGSEKHGRAENSSRKPSLYGLSSFTVNNFEGNTVNYSSCSHDQYCSPDSCIHKSICCSHKLHCAEARPPVIEKHLKDIVSPLNTERVRSYRKEIGKKEVVISILSDGQVCLECWKFKKNKRYVFRVYNISSDGLKITVCRLKKSILLDSEKPPVLSDKKSEVYTFENLPNTHWRNYQLAKWFVDKMKCITPKIYYYGAHGVCIMMENSPNPNYEYNFYDGFKIIEAGEKRIIKDNKGCIVDKINDKLLEEFKELKTKCVILEEQIRVSHDSNFPVTCGRKPEVSKTQCTNKENVTQNHVPSSLRGTLNDMKPYAVTINIEDGPHFKPLHRNTSTPRPSLLSMVSPNNTPSRQINFKIKIENDFIIAEYEDGILMYISMQVDGQFLFKNAHTGECLLLNDYPHLLERYKSDSSTVLFHALQINKYANGRSKT